MSAASDFLENMIVDWVFRARTPSKPTALWIALATAVFVDAGGGTEITGGSYARVNLAPSDTNWFGTHGTTSGNSSGTSGATSNAVVITFPTPTADWGVVIGWGIFDASSGGNLLLRGALSVPRTILFGDLAPTFPASAFVVNVG